jgi:hypothetical protein
MDELEEQRELDILIEEQEKDDTSVIYSPEPGHRDDVSIHGMDNTLAVDEDGELLDLTEHERGTVLVGNASWHGTIAGYTKHGCRKLCCRDVWATYQRAYRARKREERQEAKVS